MWRLSLGVWMFVAGCDVTITLPDWLFDEPDGHTGAGDYTWTRDTGTGDTGRGDTGPDVSTGDTGNLCTDTSAQQSTDTADTGR